MAACSAPNVRGFAMRDISDLRAPQASVILAAVDLIVVPCKNVLKGAWSGWYFYFVPSSHRYAVIGSIILTW